MSEKEFWTPPEVEKEQDAAPEPFLRRWARLKSDPAVREDGEATETPAAPPSDEDATAAPGETPAASGEQSTPMDEDLPPLETLDEHSDYSGFMSSRVSNTLRKQALRKLFRSEKFNYISDMDEYTDDFTSFPPLGDMVTADMKHAAERLLKKQLEAEEEAAAAEADADEAPEVSDPPDAPGDEAVAAQAPPAQQPSADASAEEPAAAIDNDNEEKQRDA